MRRAAIVGVMFLVGMATLKAQAAVPEVVSFQARLSDSGGNAVTDGAHNVTFRIHDSEAAVVGDEIWADTVSVTTKDGLFSVLLGHDTVPLGLAFGTQYWLGIEVETDGEMTPRFRLAAAPYAITAKYAETAGDANTVGGMGAADLLDKATYDADTDGKVDVAASADSVDWADVANIPADIADGDDVGAGGGLTTLDGVSPASGSIDFIEGTGVAITPNDTTDTIEIAVRVGTADGEIVAVQPSGMLPALDGNQLTGVVAVDSDMVDGVHASTTPEAGKLLALDGAGKLPADITGDADTVDGKHAADLMDAATDNWVDEAGDTMTGPLQLAKIAGSTASVNFEMDESMAGTTVPLDIPDDDPTGVSDTIAVPSMPGIAGFTVSVQIPGHSNVAELEVRLTAPDATEYVLHGNTGSGATIDTTYPTPTAPASGDLSTWIGQDPAGTWTLTVVDSAATTGTTDGQLAAWRIDVDAPSRERVVVRDGDLHVAGGKMISPMWNVTQVMNQVPGGLPKGGSFTSNGGTLMIIASGSGYRSPTAGRMGMAILIDGVAWGYAKSYTNEVASHKAFATNALVVTGLAPGTHTLQLESWNSTSSNSDDFFSATVVEYPF